MSKRKADACTEGANKKPLKRIEQKFRENYSEQFPCVKRSSVSIYHALCTVCVYDFKVSHGGILDVQRHVKSARHTQISDCKKATPSVTNFFSENCEYCCLSDASYFSLSFHRFLPPVQYSYQLLKLFLSGLCRGWQV
eukprot:TRINITY_DN1993_c0_g1_i8.p1 TRINITY_DN1993_c0_g1~~TRINITY_DN1993_c0_g1_i8.p1  ORF type:complete len:138 (+),score=6.72 TRINITY_DN1993_c0_g1_i8:441-854(+)